MATGLAFVTAKRYDDATSQERNAFYLASLQEDGYIYFNDDIMWRCTYDGDYVQLFYFTKEIWINTTALEVISIKKFDAEMLMRIQTGGTSIAPWIPTAPGQYGQGVEAAVLWAIDIANNPACGYDWDNRTGPNYDCASLIAAAFNQAGFPIDVNDWTGVMREDFTNAGFSWHTDWWIHYTSYLQRGDILLDEVNHVEMYIGDGQNVAAHFNEFGEVYGGKSGDQSDYEISVTDWSDFGYYGILRWEWGNSVTPGGYTD